MFQNAEELLQSKKMYTDQTFWDIDLKFLHAVSVPKMNAWLRSLELVPQMQSFMGCGIPLGVFLKYVLSLR